MGCKKLQFDSI